MEKLNMYQVCYTTDGKGKNRKVTATETVNGESLVDVYTAISERDNVTTPFVVYPLATLDSGESVYMLADYVAKQYNKWKLRNNAAVMPTLKKSLHDKEDERQTAATAVCAALADGAANMYETFNAAYNALTAESDKLYRISATEYNPAALFCNPFMERKLRATFPALCRLIAKATDAAALTEKQAEVLEMYESGTTCADALELLEINKRSYYQHLYTALYKILTKAAEIDKDGATFAAAGISMQDVADAIAAYGKRARVRAK